MNTSQTIQVMLVDDHNVVRSGLATFLRAYDDLELVGEARNGLEAVHLCHQKQPDVILMDLMMPEMDGIAATRAILADYPEIKIIAMTSFEEEQLVQGVLAAGRSVICSRTSLPMSWQRRSGRRFRADRRFPRKPPGCSSRRLAQRKSLPAT